MRDLGRSSFARVWLPVLVFAAVLATLDRHADAGDLPYFVHQGERMLSSRWADTFADPTLQAGPLQLLLAGSVRNLTALAYLVEVGVAALVVLVCARLGVARRWQLAAGLAAVAVGLTHGAFVDGHPAEAVTPLLWILAAVEVRRGRAAAAGALVGLSAGLELWGALGVSVLLLAPRARAFAVAASVVVAMFAPFVLFGRFGMFDYEWRVAHGTLLSSVIGPGTHFGWTLRVLQAAVACAVGGTLAWRLRSVHAVWIVPLAVVLVRIALDPLAYGWYWLEAEAIAIVGAAIALTEPPLRSLRARATSAPPVRIHS